jgi:hypothetical protein
MSTQKGKPSSEGESKSVKAKAPPPKPKGIDTMRFDEATAGKLRTLGMIAGVVGLVCTGAAYAMDAKRFPFSYLTGFAFVTTIGIGALFFIVIQHLTKAGWSVTPRRHMEWLSSILLVVPALFVPVAVFSHTLYEHWMGEHAHHDPIVSQKVAYLNPTFFYLRAAVFMGLWVALSWWFSKTSAEQDQSGDKKLTVKMQNAAAPSVLVLALSMTFAGFDWLMSLDPHWYSTIFGVYIFAGGIVTALACLALITIQLQRTGLLKKVSTVEHQHDIGKLFFGFVVFWAYIAFSQFILIWYANIPEETVWYKHRWEHGWSQPSMLLFLGHFVLPFVWLISRTAKRSRLLLGAAAVWILCMHFVDMYWLVMPTFDHHFHPSPVDLLGLLGPVGIAAAVVAMRAAKSSLYPLRDPRLAESLRVENL